ncbi:hypothetical protein [Phenylobacterium deserti]|uniref:Uncharacterized protein n=1 Tax=Phenylobacterium deserti TaxID=1914756 RepID=A0A328AVV9_9CAUL|nr:hypothetical protein [Phenylobacterium deserti]RAK57058.1 hypothetical protein DJ018_03615 [Phenylobacterium deserti]
MRRLVVCILASTLALAACGQRFDPAQVEQAVTPCGTGLTTLGALADLASAGAQDPTYVAQAEQVAATCRTARQKLVQLKAPKACLEVADTAGTAAAALKAAFSAAGPRDVSPALSAADRAGIACTEALGR